MQLQKTEDSSADTLEFERLKDHFEPLLGNQAPVAAPSGPSGTRNTPLSAINAAANSALQKEVPGVRRKGRASDAFVKRPTAKDEFTSSYKSRIDSAAGGVSAQSELDWIRDMTQEEFVSGEVAKVQQRWTTSWTQFMKSTYVSLNVSTRSPRSLNSKSSTAN